MLGVAKSGYYARLRRASGQATALREQEQAALCTVITEQCARHKQRYGRPRMTDQLKKLGFAVNHKRVGQVMKRLGLQCKLRRKFKICTTDSKHDYPIAANVLNRQFTQDAPNKAWALDYRDIVHACGMVTSMSRKGNCWDNAAMESVNGTLKVECVNRQRYETRELARQDVLEFIGYYNHEREHTKRNGGRGAMITRAELPTAVGSSQAPTAVDNSVFRLFFGVHTLETGSSLHLIFTCALVQNASQTL